MPTPGLPPPTTLPITPAPGRVRALLLPPSPRPARRRRRHHHVAAPITSPAPTTTPTAMPALAPALNPPPVSSAFTTLTPLPVGVMGLSAQCALASIRVQLWVAAQHPPPRVAAHEIWPVVHPGGASDRSSDVVGAGVNRHWPAAPQRAP